MILVIDTHVHFYSNFDLDAALDAGLQNAAEFLPKDTQFALVLCLTERFDCDFFSVLSSFTNIVTIDEGLLAVERAGKTIYILQGFQVLSLENIEVLGLGLLQRPLDRRIPLLNLVDDIKTVGSLAVIPWGLGKWRGASKALREAVLKSSPTTLLTTTALHHPGLRSSFEKRHASSRLVYGSDPLPAPHEEALVGSLVSVFEVDNWDEKRATLLTLLQKAPLQNKSKPVSLLQIVRRELRRRFQLSWI